MKQNNSIFRTISVILMSFILFNCLPSCVLKNKQKLQSFEFFEYFDTFSSITIYESDKDKLSGVKSELNSMLQEYDMLLDRYEPHDGITNLYSLNQNAGNGKVAVDEKLFSAISLGIQMHKMTDGECNIALGSVIKLWHDARDTASSDPASAYVPSSEAISTALLHTDISSIILDGTDNSVQITDPDLSIDLGAIAKGYVAQKVSELLVSLGYKDHLINLGGNVLALGNKSDGTKWSALIEDPLADERKWESNVVELSDQTLVTSGSYQRFFTVDGKKYSHIISNRDGMPPELFVSVSILAPASLSYLSDALSTALFCMDIESGKRLIASVNGVDAVWLYSDGTVVSTIDEVGE
jgi:thiamine biosynthesis lipoprotein